MKVTNKISQIAAIILAVSALVLFLFPFVSFNLGETAHELTGAQLAFGDKVEGLTMHKSAHITFCAILTIATAAFAAGTFAKSKKIKYVAPALALVDGVYMLVILLSKVSRFVDTRPLSGVSDLSYTGIVLAVVIVLLATGALGVAHLLIDDKLTVMGDKDKLTIPKRVVRFLRDYKSEVKKIVWPGLNEVVKNTIIVLVICCIVGLFIWAVDYGLGSLVEFIATKL